MHVATLSVLGQKGDRLSISFDNVCSLVQTEVTKWDTTCGKANWNAWSATSTSMLTGDTCRKWLSLKAVLFVLAKHVSFLARSKCFRCHPAMLLWLKNRIKSCWKMFEYIARSNSSECRSGLGMAPRPSNASSILSCSVSTGSVPTLTTLLAPGEAARSRVLSFMTVTLVNISGSIQVQPIPSHVFLSIQLSLVYWFKHYQCDSVLKFRRHCLGGY